MRDRALDARPGSVEHSRVTRAGSVAEAGGHGAAVLAPRCDAVAASVRGGRSSSSPVAARQTPVSFRHSYDVLLVATDTDVADRSSAALVTAGHTVHVASDADLALSTLRRARFLALIVDVEGTEGFRLLHALRAQPALRPSAVLVIAASSKRSPVLAAIEAGADDYIRKPLDANDLTLRTSLWLRRVSGAAPMALPGLRIHSLGGFSVERESKRLLHDGGRARKANALFKYLLTHPDHKAPTAEVLDLLWPDTDEETAATDLRSLLYQLRRLLGSSAQGESCLEHTGMTLSLRLKSTDWWDVREFKASLNEAAQWRRVGETIQALRAYEAGVALYAGDYLREDLYADWATSTREGLRDAWLRAQSALAILYGERGDHESKEALLRSILRADPYREQSYRALMELLVSQGRTAEALVFHRRLADLLQAEFAARPDPETQALVRLITQRTS